jgi:membrane protein
MYIPNTRVRFLSASLAGVITGISFQVLQWGYLNSQVWLTSYNAIYGSFAALPLFLLMCQIAWTITLFGCTLAYVNQNFKSFYRGKENVLVSRRFHDYLCLRFVSSICERYARKENPYTVEELAERHDVHIRLVTQIIYTLCKVGILIETTNEGTSEKTTYVPAHDIQQITTSTLLNALDVDGNELIDSEDANIWEDYCKARNEMQVKSFKDVPLHMLFADTNEGSTTHAHEQNIL